jgi:NAD(P)-dependent dehydrogenase (short-subunit alcohol dehydrogenase family)
MRALYFPPDRIAEFGMDVCLITGTSTGIGEAAALNFARAGYRVYATMRNLAKSGPLKEAVAAEDLPVTVVQLDVTDQASVDRAVGEVLEAEGKIDVLVNNAGLGAACPVETYPEDEHRALFETNYWGPVRLIQAVLPGMRERGAGAILNVSSIMGRTGGVNQAAYCATKFAIEGLSESLAVELAPLGIRVAIIEPGVIGTPIFDNTPMHYDKSSPYLRTMKQCGLFYRTTMAQATPPGEIGDLMVEAVKSEPPRLRWLHGVADGLAERRAHMTDEDYVSLSSLEGAAYIDRYKELFRIELVPATK